MTADPLVAPQPRQPAPGASRALRRIYQGALRAMPLQHRRDRAHSPRVVMAPPLRRAISPLMSPTEMRTRRRRRRPRSSTTGTQERPRRSSIPTVPPPHPGVALSHRENDTHANSHARAHTHAYTHFLFLSVCL